MRHRGVHTSGRLRTVKAGHLHHSSRRLFGGPSWSGAIVEISQVGDSAMWYRQLKLRYQVQQIESGPLAESAKQECLTSHDFVLLVHVLILPIFSSLQPCITSPSNLEKRHAVQLQSHQGFELQRRAHTVWSYGVAVSYIWCAMRDFHPQRRARRLLLAISRLDKVVHQS